MVNSLYERDFTQLSAVKRPGRLDFRLLNNIDNAGDGYPGLQKAIRNWHFANIIEVFVEPGESIQDAIDNAMSEREYCVVILKAGTHNVDTFPIQIDNSGSAIWIRGEDKGVTTIEADTTYDNIFEVLNSKTTIISDIYFDCLDWDSSNYGSVILVNEANDNPAYVYRISAICGYAKGPGGVLVEVQSNNVYVEYCDLDDFDTFIEINANCSNINIGYNILGDDVYNLLDNEGSYTISHIHIYNNYAQYTRLTTWSATISHFTIFKNYLSAININQCDNLSIVGNYVYNADYSFSFEVSGCDYFNVSNNIIHSTTSSNYPGRINSSNYGSIIGNEFVNDSNALYGLRIDNDCTYLRIIGNHVAGCQYGIDFNDNANCIYNVVANNTVYNCSTYPIRLTSGSNYNVISGNYTDTTPISIGSSFNAIKGNVCRNSTNGISISGSHNSVLGNNCAYNTSSGINISGSNNAISGNLCNYNTLYGIYCTGSANSINGNTCSNNNLSSSTSGGGIYLNTNADYNNVSGNMCYGNANGGSGTGYGIFVGSGCDDNLIASNNCQGNDTQFNDSGTGTVSDTADATSGDNLNRFD